MSAGRRATPHTRRAAPLSLLGERDSLELPRVLQLFANGVELVKGPCEPCMVLASNNEAQLLAGAAPLGASRAAQLGIEESQMGLHPASNLVTARRTGNGCARRHIRRIPPRLLTRS